MRKILLLSFMLFGMVPFLWAQKALNGAVVGPDGSGLPGVNVVVKGTTTGTITDFDGNYRMSVAEDATTLVFTYIGYATQEVEIGARSVIDVTLEVDVTELQEVVVTAQGIERKKEALGFAVSSVGADEVANKTEGDIARSLRSKASGVQITQQNGLSGSGSNVIIRGYTSITGDNQPLFIVDGVPFNTATNLSGGDQDPNRAENSAFADGQNNGSSRFLDLDPNNIEDISILKGLAASTLYGAQGRNGVILITTKGGGSGSANKKMDITVNQSYYINEIASTPDYQDQFGNGFNAVFGWFFSNWGPGFFEEGLAGWGADATILGGNPNNPDWGLLPHPYSQYRNPALRAVFPDFQRTGTEPDAVNSPGAARPGAPYDWRPYDNAENFFRTGHAAQTSVNVRGRSADGNSTYNVNFGYTDEEGFVPGNGLERINFGVGGRTKLSNNFTVSSTMNLSRTDYVAPPISASTGNGAFNPVAGQATPVSSSVIGHVFFTPRSVDLNGLPFENPVDGSSTYYRNGNDIQNPRWTAANAFNGALTNRIYGNTGVTYTLNDNINVAYRIGYDIYAEDAERGQNVGGLDGDVTGGYSTFTNTNSIWDHTFTLNGAYDLNEALRLSFNVGSQLRRNVLDRQGVRSQNQLVFGTFRHFNFTAQSPIQNRQEQNIVGIFGQAEFDYNGYLFVTLAGRRDAVSNFTEDNRSLFYPSVSAAFLLSDVVPEITNNNILNGVKLRAGFGTSAGFRNGFPVASTLNLQPREFIDAGGNVVSTNTTGIQLGNEELKPERQEEFEIGTEIKGWNNRASLELSWYRRASTDLIVRRPLDPATGFARTFTNIGEVINKGVEIDLGVDVLQINDWNWNVRANFTAINSEVTELGEGITEINIAGFSNRGNFAIEGESLGVMLGSTILRNENGDRVVDGQGNYSIDQSNSVIGDPIPDFTLNASSNLSWKNLDFNFLINYVQGGDIFSSTVTGMIGRGVTTDTEDRVQTFIFPGVQNTGTNDNPVWVENLQQVVNSTYYFNNIMGGPDELRVIDGTAVRLQEIGLSYSLPTSVLDNTPFGAVRIGVQGFNLWYKAVNAPDGVNFDPNAAGLGVGNGQGFDYLNAPSSKRYGFNVRLSF